MKKNLTFFGSIILSVLLLLLGCQKQINEPTVNELQSEESQSKNDHDGEKNECRLTVYDYYDGIGDFHSIDNFSYKRGLVDEWAVSYGSVFKMEYNDGGRLKKSRMYNGGVLVNTIQFFYKNDKVAKEVWYNGNTQEAADEIFYTYNRKGQMIRSESFITDYYVTNTYTVNGDLESWKFYSGGSPFVSGEYTYRKHYKNSYKATPGIDYSFPFANSAFGTAEWWYSGEKIIFYDGAGTPSVYYDLDPHETRFQTGSQNYPVHVDYVDAQSGRPFSIGFEFENCGRSDGDHHDSKETNNRNVSSSPGKSHSISAILSGPREKIQQRVNELRQQLKSIKNSSINN